MSHRLLALFLIPALAGLLAGGCSKSPSEPEVTDAGPISDYVSALEYDGESMLNVQETGQEDVLREEGETQKLVVPGPNDAPKVCYETAVNLKQNFDKVAILRPTAGVIYPGALVKANTAMMDGVPEPVSLSRAPVVLSIDLPGMGDRGIVRVENPTNSNVQAAIDNALEWWNANAYQDGYVNGANSAYNYTSSYSSQQTALDIGLNLSWATGDFAGKFSLFTSVERSVLTASFQQAFYTVTFDTPLDPAEVFASSVGLDAVQAELTPEAPPAYVSSVVYGRILVFRMESTSAVLSADLEAAFNYGVGRLSASGDLKAHYDEILSESKVEVITLGGNAEVASQLVTGNLIDVITGPNAVYARGNPGVPVAYTVKYLKDNSVAKLGYTTEYTKRECIPSHEIILSFGNISIPGDCDGIEGDGEFEYLLEIWNGDGAKVASTSGSATVGAGDAVSVSVKVHRFVIRADQAQEFKVRLTLSEWDRDIFGNTWRDTRMDLEKAEWRHFFRDGAWSDTRKTLTVGSSGDCKGSIAYSFTAGPV